jgi:cytochrome d ubiquinol oxidase subunit I
VTVDALDLARLQFALTISFHFIFPAITIGLSGLLAIVETIRWYKRSEAYDRLAVFLARLFAVTFVTGVVSGIVMEFQFGTNWSVFSGYVGDIFGAPLAAEGIFSFFLESAFLGVLLFGRRRVSSTVRWLSAVLVAFGTLLSAFWILVANSWMQTPAGYACYPDPNNCSTATKVVLTDFLAAVLNPSILPRFMHTVSACYVAGSFFLMSVSAYYVLRKRHLDIARPALRLAMIVAFLGAGAMFVTGDTQTREVAEYEPLKFAAMEGICHTEKSAALTIFDVPPSQDCSSNPSGPLAVPDGLSLMMYFDANSTVKGLDQEPNRNLWPPVSAVFFGFHTMVAIGTIMLLLMLIGVFFLWRGSLEKHRWWLKLAVLALPLPLIAVEVGWMVTEMGRQPWIVQNLLMTSQGVSPNVSAGDMAISIAGILVTYSVLFFLWLYSLRKEIIRGPDPAPEAATAGTKPAAEGGN